MSSRTKTLYIIGNGFDIHHRIKSSYRDFCNWMYENNPAVVDQVNEIYGVCTEEWWSDFENQLASLDAISYATQIASENQPDLLSDHCDRMWNDAQIEVEYQLESVYSELRDCFHDWILQLGKPDIESKIILETENAIFINFNYTKTLEEIYEVAPNKILHIHGCVDIDEEFILGHGECEEDLRELNRFDVPKPSECLSDEELIDFYQEMADIGPELHEQWAIDAAISGVASQQKPVKRLMHQYALFFDSIKDVESIKVYGLSLSKVDMPYLEYFVRKFPSAKWEFSDYDDENKKIIERFCQDNNLRSSNIIRLEDILINKR